MTFIAIPHGFENGPTERYEFDVPLHPTQGPSWSTDVLLQVGPKFFQSVPRCRAMHPDHDCQCIQQANHRGGSDSRHHCWHRAAVYSNGWPAWRRGKTDLVLVPSKRNLVKSEVGINSTTRKIHIEPAHIVDGEGIPV